MTRATPVRQGPRLTGQAPSGNEHIESVEGPAFPVKHWSYSSLITFLRNPLAWYKRYVEGVYDMPSSPASIVGRAAHTAVQHFYGGIGKEGAIDLGREYLRNVPDFEINFGKATSRRAKKLKRAAMERDYAQAASHYLERPPKHRVVGIEVSHLARVDGLLLPIKAVSDLVVESPVEEGALDIVDHKFVDSYSALRGGKTLFVVQAMFNYYTVRDKFGKSVRRFVLYECRKRKNADGRPQLRRYVIDFQKSAEEFKVFHRLLRDATHEISRPRVYLPNPSDLFEGENSFDIYRLGLAD